MKKILNIMLILVLALTLISCDNEDDDTEEEENDVVETLNIYYLNDLHGKLLEESDYIGMSKISNVILDEKEKNPNSTLFIAGGDMMQGHLMSNHFKGQSTIDILNKMQLDAFVIGNHEFDWGLDVTLGFFNGNNPIQANFPLLGANVLEEQTNQRVDGIEPYTMITKGNLTVSIIGLIGEGLETSIAANRISGYYFDEPLEYIKEYAKESRENGADIVLVVTHSGFSGLESQIAQLTGLSYVDAVFNGHTHQEYVDMIQRDSIAMPVIQSSSDGRVLGNVKFHFEDGIIDDVSAKNLSPYSEPRLSSDNQQVLELVNFYADQIDSLLNETILVSGSYYDTEELSDYIAYLMARKTNSFIGVHNYGGTRVEISAGENITYAKIISIFPFDNALVTFSLRGSDLMSFAYNYSYSIPSQISLSAIDPNQLYSVVTNDYIFNGSAWLQNVASNVSFTTDLLHEVMAEALNYMKNNGQTHFYTTNNVEFTSYVNYAISNFHHINI